MSKKYTLSQIAAIYTVYKDLDVGTRTVNCCTCGKSIHIEQIEDCYSYYGHYIARSKEPKLKYHPGNAFAQCVSCNMSTSSDIENKYSDYIIKRFGKDYTDKLLNLSAVDDNVYYEYYIKKLSELSLTFPELKTVVDINYSLSKSKDLEELNNIVKQWNTFSSTYKQDLDELVKIIKTENVEYERF